MHRIAIVGPESSGKTTLCAALAEHYRCPWVPESARRYLEDRRGRYDANDLPRIAEAQCASEDRVLRTSPYLVFCDTDMITIRIWYQEKFHGRDPRLERLVTDRHYDHWLLCRPDIPWEADPLRENPHDRDRLFLLYKHMLRDLRRPCTIIEGARAHRLHSAIAAVDALLVRP